MTVIKQFEKFGFVIQSDNKQASLSQSNVFNATTQSSNAASPNDTNSTTSKKRS